MFGDFVDRIYHIKLEIKDTTDTARSASYLDLHLEIDNEGRLRTKLNFQHGEWYLSWSGAILELVVYIPISLIEGCC